MSFMKTIVAVLSVAFLIITACMLYLVKTGISLRAQPLIRPSIVSPDQHNVAHAVILRLFPQLKTSHSVVWGVKPETPEIERVLEMMAAEFEKAFGQKVNVIKNGETASAVQLRACQKPCWIFVSADQAHHLGNQTFLTEKIQPLQRPYLTITWIPFTFGAEVPEKCETEKRLDFVCLKALSVHEAAAKIKTLDRYFFMKIYNEIDVFLFMQEPRP